MMSTTIAIAIDGKQLYFVICILDSQAKHDDVEICKSSCSYVFIYTRKVCR